MASDQLTRRYVGKKKGQASGDAHLQGEDTGHYGDTTVQTTRLFK